MSVFHRRPKFSSGKLLRNEYLVALEQQSFDFPNLFFQGWGSGVLTGCRLSTTADTITMGPGVVRFEGALYGIHEPLSAAYSPTDETRFLKLYVGSNEGNSACVVRRFSLKLAEQETLGSGELELCRFRLQPGARLRCSYTDFRDRNTIYDTLNVIHGTFAAPDGTSLNPDITSAYAQEALGVEGLPDLDAAVCLQWLDQRFAQPGRAVRAYLRRTGCLGEGEGCQAMFQGLLRRLEQLKAGPGAPQTGPSQGRRKILID